MARRSTASIRKFEVRCRRLPACRGTGEGVTSRHRNIPGFDQERLSLATVAQVGAGGLGGETGEGLARKGIGRLILFDGDTVEITNLNRQRFGPADIGRNKAVSLARRLRHEGYAGTRIRAYPFFLQEALELGLHLRCDLLFCGVDNDQTRVFVARQALALGVPAIFTAVSRDANQGYAFVQEPGKACFGCAFPEAVSNDRAPCPGVPAVKDILKVVSGLALYAVDSVLMERPRDWNFRLIYLAGFVSDKNRLIERNPACPICSPDKSLNYE